MCLEGVYLGRRWQLIFFRLGEEITGAMHCASTTHPLMKESIYKARYP